MATVIKFEPGAPEAPDSPADTKQTNQKTEQELREALIQQRRRFNLRNFTQPVPIFTPYGGVVPEDRRLHYDPTDEQLESD